MSKSAPELTHAIVTPNTTQMRHQLQNQDGQGHAGSPNR